jgi:hypothetical protein
VLPRRNDVSDPRGAPAGRPGALIRARLAGNLASSRQQIRSRSKIALEIARFDGRLEKSLPTPDKVAFMALICPNDHVGRLCRAEGARARVEPEIAFVLGHDLPRRTQPYSDGDVRTAVRETRLVLELIGCRYADPGSATFLEMLADGLNGEGLFIGPEVSEGLTRPLENIQITVAADAATILTHAGSHGDGHPLRPLVWLANFLASHGEGLTAGQIVTTGSYAGVLELPLATPLDIRFRDLGTLSVQFVGME